MLCVLVLALALLRSHVDALPKPVLQRTLRASERDSQDFLSSHETNFKEL